MNHNHFQIHNVISDGIVTSEKYFDKLVSLLNQISKSDDRLAANYSIESVQLDKHLSFDLLADPEDKIISFAGVFSGGRYPEGVYRVLNRTWVAPEHRVDHGKFKYLTSKFILNQQLQVLEKRLKLVFVSRERPTGGLFLEKWRRSRTDSDLWTVSEDLVQVVPDVEKKSCYQFICSRQFGKSHWHPKRISLDEWRKLPE